MHRHKQKAVSCCKKFFGGLAQFFRFWSVGKLQLSSYHNEKLTYSSVIGGLLSLALIGLTIFGLVLVWINWLYSPITLYETEYVSLNNFDYMPTIRQMSAVSFLDKNSLRLEVVSKASGQYYSSMCADQVVRFPHLQYPSRNLREQNEFYDYDYSTNLTTFTCIYIVDRYHEIYYMNDSAELFEHEPHQYGQWPLEPTGLDLQIINTHTNKDEKNLSVQKVNIQYHYMKPSTDKLSNLETEYTVYTSAIPKMIQLNFVLNMKHNHLIDDYHHGQTEDNLFIGKMEERQQDITNYTDANNFTLQFRSGMEVVYFHETITQQDGMVPVVQAASVFAFAYVLFSIFGFILKPLHECCFKRDLRKMALKSKAPVVGQDVNRPEPLLGEPLVINDISSYYHNQSRIDQGERVLDINQNSPTVLFSYQNLKELTELVRQQQVTLKACEEKINYLTQANAELMLQKKQSDLL